MTIDEANSPKEKLKLTHDCSWIGSTSSHSLNSRINEDLLAPLQYGRCIYRVLHSIQHLRSKHPSKRILLAKHDLDSAYRRLHWKAKIALLSITIVGSLAYILTRLCFGISSGPSEWCLISELIVDFANILILDPTWSTDSLRTSREGIPSSSSYLNDTSAPFKTKKLMYNIEIDQCHIDGYIDDLITIILDTEDLQKRANHVIPLLLHTFFRPVHNSEPYERTDVLSDTKLKAEGQLEEKKTFLGWIINTRNLRINLPSLKAMMWINEIDTVISQVKVKPKNLESLIGKLNHAAFIIPFTRYFLNRLRFKLELMKKKGPLTLSKSETEDLIFFKDALAKMSTDGAPIESITYSYPDIFCWSDASEFGIGGFDHTGSAWRWLIPPHLQHTVSINVLEFIASISTIMISAQKLPKGIKFLALTDNSSALGWLYKASFHPASKEHHDTIARYFAKFMMNRDHSLFASHIPGPHNEVADALSRRFDLNNDELTNFLLSSYSNKVPQNFKIVQPPNEIISWIASILGMKIANRPSQTKQSRNTKDASRNGKIFAHQRVSKIYPCQASQEAKNRTFCARSQQKSDEMSLENLRKKFCTDQLWKTHSDLFVQSSGLEEKKIRELMKVA